MYVLNQSSALAFDGKLVLSPVLHSEGEMTPKICFFEFAQVRCFFGVFQIE